MKIHEKIDETLFSIWFFIRFFFLFVFPCIPAMIASTFGASDTICYGLFFICMLLYIIAIGVYATKDCKKK